MAGNKGSAKTSSLARIHMSGADDYLEDAVCLLGHIEMDPNADPENDIPQRTARMAVEKIREAQRALKEAAEQMPAAANSAVLQH